MQIQKIQLSVLKNNRNANNINAIPFTRKLVQPDSFINAPRRTKKTDGIDLISVASRISKERNDRINRYVESSKKELKTVQKTAKAHKKQCLGILKKAEKCGYDKPIDADEYNITFGTIDPDTKKPSSINIWEDGRLVQQYNILSLKPLNIEAYDCELKTFNEEFYITENGLAVYKAHNKSKNTMELIIPSPYGFYKVEGEWNNATNSIIKSKELEYTDNKIYPSTYSQYDSNETSHYQFDTKTKDWCRKLLSKSNILTLKN